MPEVIYGSKILLLGVYNNYNLENPSFKLCDNFNLTNNDLEQLKYEALNENKQIIPKPSKIPVSLYNIGSFLNKCEDKDDMVEELKKVKIEFGPDLAIISENEGIEIGRYDMLSNVIRIWEIAQLLPFSVIKYIIFHELMHVLIFDHNTPFYTILNQYPKKLEIEQYLGVIQKYLKRHHIIKYKENYYFRIKKELSGIYIDDEKFLQCKYILRSIPFLR